MSSLRAKLILAFLAVSVAGAVLSVVFASWSTTMEFNRLLQEQQRATFAADVTSYYEAKGTWEGIARNAGQPGQPPANPPPNQPGTNRAPGQPPGNPPPGQPAASPPSGQPPANPPPEQPAASPLPPPFILVDRNGIVLLAPDPTRIGARIPPAEVASGQPIEIDGQVVGAVLDTKDPAPRDPAEETYLIRTNRVLLIGALGGAAIALVLGVLVARTLTGPLRDLTRASRSMAAGELGQHVTVRSRDELGELAAAFNQMSADLAQADQQRQQMTADIAHDLRTPLTVLSGYLEAMRDGDLPPTSARLKLMDDEVQVLRRLVDDLRTLSLADAGKLALNRQPLAPLELLERVAAAYQRQAGQLGIDLHVDAAAGLPAVDADPERLVQVLGNLVGNALRYTPVGGQIELAARPEGESVLLTVSDTGKGIAAADLPLIFDRFHRADPSRSADGGETGLGLAIAKSIVEAHGGRISVESELNRGTIFTLRLPASLASG